eukprot:gene5463-biopygen11738
MTRAGESCRGLPSRAKAEPSGERAQQKKNVRRDLGSSRAWKSPHPLRRGGDITPAINHIFYAQHHGRLRSCITPAIILLSALISHLKSATAPAATTRGPAWRHVGSWCPRRAGRATTMTRATRSTRTTRTTRATTTVRRTRTAGSTRVKRTMGSATTTRTARTKRAGRAVSTASGERSENDENGENDGNDEIDKSGETSKGSESGENDEDDENDENYESGEGDEIDEDDENSKSGQNDENDGVDEIDETAGNNEIAENDDNNMHDEIDEHDGIDENDDTNKHDENHDHPSIDRDFPRNLAREASSRTAQGGGTAGNSEFSQRIKTGGGGVFGPPPVTGSEHLWHAVLTQLTQTAETDRRGQQKKYYPIRRDPDLYHLPAGCPGSHPVPPRGQGGLRGGGGVPLETNGAELLFEPIGRPGLCYLAYLQCANCRFALRRCHPCHLYTSSEGRTLSIRPDLYHLPQADPACQPGQPAIPVLRPWLVLTPAVSPDSSGRRAYF